MISSINSSTAIQLPPARQQQKLTEEQQTLISDTLKEFDADNLTETDAVSIVKSFAEAGITASQELDTALSDLGFDGKKIGELSSAKIEAGMQPPTPSQSSEEISSMTSYFDELLKESLDSSGETEVSDQEKQVIYSQVMDKFGIKDGDSLINTTV